MAYATIADMVTRFGQAEMVRATTPDGQPAVAIVTQPLEAALADASSVIDSYLRKRYQVPLDVAPAEIKRACCILARYDLSTGGERAPSEQIQKSRDEAVMWLGRVAKGDVLLDLQEVGPGDESFSAMQTRGQVFGDAPFGGCGPGGGFGFPGTGEWWP